MKILHSLRRILVAILLITPFFALSGCGDFPFFKSKPIPSKSTRAEQYILAQALAELALETEPNNKKLLKSYTKVLNAHGAEKTKELQVAVLSIEYTLSGQSDDQAVLVPVPVSATMPSFKALQQVQKKLSALPHTLHDLRAYYALIPFPPAQKFSHDPSVLQQQLKDARQEMMDGMAPLPDYENAKLQLQLVQFFIKAHVRDAAYLALENAKDFLASMAEKSPDRNISSLSQEADALESRLRKEMPYKL
jgi:hypothetical protein